MVYDPTIPNSKDISDIISPLLSSVSASNVTDKTAVINISGSDNSGSLFYYLNDAANNVSEVLFLSGVTIRNLTTNTQYNFTVTPIDFSGNQGISQTLKFKTLSPQGNIQEGTTGTNYNSISSTSNPEANVTITRLGSTLTLGITTEGLTYNGNTSRQFYNPTIKIDNVSYPLNLDANGTTATTTFNNTIGSTTIADYSTFDLQWSIFWLNNDGNYFTGKYTYVVSPETATSLVSQSIVGVYPTGTNDKVYFSEPVMSTAVYQLNGRKVMNAFNVSEINVSHLPKGFYILNMRDKRGIQFSTKIQIL